AVAEHAAKFVAVADAGGEQALHRILGGRAQPARARRAVGAATELDRERVDVGIGIAGTRHHRGLDLEHAAGVEEVAHQAIEPRAQAQCQPRSRRAHECSSRKASSRASSQTSTPSSVALASLEPASAPATRKPVFFETLPETLAPSASSFALASSRPMASSVPVITTVTPSSGPALAAPFSGSAASSSACIAAAASSMRALASSDSHSATAVAVSSG